MAVQLTQFTDPQKTTLAVVSVDAIPGEAVKKALKFPDGSYASAREDGTIGSEPSVGPFEKFDIDGQVATAWYAWNGVTYGPFSFAFMKVSGKS